MSWRELKSAVEDPAGPLWVNGSSSVNGHNDRVAEDRLSQFKHSLCLVRPDDLTLIVGMEASDYRPARRRVRGRFSPCGHSYCLSVTDPVVERRCLEGSENEIELDEALVCVSLTEAFHEFAYKLIAAVITPRRAEG